MKTIADGSYKVSRPLFYYIKKEHMGVVPGIEEYDAMFKSLSISGGPLEAIGLIPAKQ
jgi:phosphate transport system substrate-binding protein